MARASDPPSEKRRPELLGLLEECKANPQDDAPRLVLADWLEEHGDEQERARAEHIRLQVQHEQQSPDVPDLGQLIEHERSLARQHNNAWVAPLSPIGYAEGRFVRGLVRPVLKKRGHRSPAGLALLGSEALAWIEGFALCWPNVGDVERFLASPLFASGTYLEVLGTLQVNEIIVRLAADPRVAHLQSLAFPACRVNDDGLRALASSRYLTGLRSLSLTSATLTGEGFAALASSPGLAGLTALDLSHGNDGPGARALASSPYLRNLRQLTLWRADLTPSDVAALVSSPNLANLERLNLSWNQVGAEGIAALAASPHLKNLICLDLSGCRLGAEELSLLARARSLGNLRSLVLKSNNVNADCLEALVHRRCFPRLSGLHLERNPLQANGAEALAGATHWKLEYLDLRGCRLGGDALTALAGWPGLASVHTLLLGNNRLGLPGARALASSSWLQQLHHLELRRVGLDGRSVQALVSSPVVGNLEFLALGENRLGEPAARALVASPHLENLQRLWLRSYPPIEEKMQRLLRKRFGRRVIQ
jgi:uncharacterized protein (TIGR02996 family)